MDNPTDATCSRCGYNLRGLSIDGRCPECGTPIIISLTHRSLRFADPVWLRSVAAGTRLWLIHLVLCTLGALAVAVSPVLAVLAVMISRLLAVLVLLVAVLGLAGAIMITRPAPDAPLRAQRKWAMGRAGLLMIVLLGENGIAVLTVVQSWAPPAYAVALVAHVATVILMLWLRRLAPRLPENNLYASATALFAVFLVWVAFALFGRIIGIFFTFSVAPIVLTLTLSLVVILALNFLLLSQFAQALRVEAQVAQDIAAANGENAGDAQ